MNIKEYEKELFDSLIKKCNEIDINKTIESIIVTGSFGRHEQTYSNGQLKSDIEIGFVYKTWTSRKERKRIAWKVQEMFDEDFNIMDMSKYRILKKCNYNNSLISTKKKTLFTYDLYNGSYTIWGEKIIEKINVSKNDIDLYEAKRIVANRIAEYNYLKNKNNSFEKQWSGKIMLAIGSAWLIINNCYQSSYHDQQKEINDNSKKIISEFGESFLKDYNNVFGYLRDNLGEYVIPKERLLLYVSKINKTFEKLNINRSRVNTITRKLKYLSKYIKNHKNIFFSMKKIMNIEDYVLSNVIKSFENNKNNNEIADFWHKVIY